jgi:hypothetical protein
MKGPLCDSASAPSSKPWIETLDRAASCGALYREGSSAGCSWSDRPLDITLDVAEQQ